MAWFKRQSGELDTSGERKVRTEGLWVKCEDCRQIIWKKDLDANLNVCPKCQRHFKVDARTRHGDISSDFGEVKVESGDRESTASGSIGSNGPHLIINGDNGTIELRKGSVAAIPPSPPTPPTPGKPGKALPAPKATPVESEN